MKVIVATGKEVLVDDDFELPRGRTIYVAKSHGYVILIKYEGKIDDKYVYSRIYLHRYITGAPDGMFVDHINGNKLDNRSCNLRVCTMAQNNMNTGPKTGKYKGVHWSKTQKKWVSQITKDGKTQTLGSFGTEEAAAIAYNKAATELYGEYAYINKVEGQ